MYKVYESIEAFAQNINDLLHSNRDVVVGVGGFTGEGKSTFLIQLNKAYCKIQGIPFTLDRMTWSRKELFKWIDGEGETKAGRLDLYENIIVDELYRMFCGRTWHDEGQIEGLVKLNTCRDRRLFISGNVPNFWELDSGFRSRVRFYVYIPIRGRAWVFTPEANPFSKDFWNVQENQKLFRKAKGPQKIANFVCEIKYEDLTAEEEAEYLAIRNTKRLFMNDEFKEKEEKYSHIVKQRNLLIGLILQNVPSLSQKDLADMIGVSEGLISMVKNGTATAKS